MEQLQIDRLMRLEEVVHLTSIGRNTVYRRMREGTFPKQVRLGPKSVAWRQSDIMKWIEDPMAYEVTQNP